MVFTFDEELEKRRQKIFDYEEKIKNTKTTEDVKKIVRIMFEDLDLEDVDFNDLIYDDVISKLKDLGVVFDTDNGNVINYEEIMKENY